MKKTILIAKDGEIVYEREFGYADLEKQGQLSITEPITRYLTDLPDFFNKVRIRKSLFMLIWTPSGP